MRRGGGWIKVKRRMRWEDRGDVRRGGGWIEVM